MTIPCVVCDQPLAADPRTRFHPCGHATHEACDPHGDAERFCPRCEIEADVLGPESP